MSSVVAHSENCPDNARNSRVTREPPIMSQDLLKLIFEFVILGTPNLIKKRFGTRVEAEYIYVNRILSPVCKEWAQLMMEMRGLLPPEMRPLCDNFDQREYRQLCKNFVLENTFIEKHWKDARYYILKYQKLSEDFLENHDIWILWSTLWKYQRVSEQFIEKHADNVIWKRIAKYQKLSGAFLEMYGDHLW